jgi:hypothetical protein
LQSESVAANCPSNKAASLWLSEQQELLQKNKFEKLQKRIKESNTSSKF